MNLNRINKILLWGAGILFVAALAVWVVSRLMGPAAAGTPSAQGGSGSIFGSAANQTTGGSGGVGGNTNQPIGVAANGTPQKIFEISTGPVAGAVFMQTGIPTTTIARYVMADSGHVFDLAVDVPGAVAKPVSNTTIPGIARTVWASNGAAPLGSAVLLQYLENETTKTVFVGFPSATSSQATTTSSNPAPLSIHFLPDNLLTLAAAPDGKNVAYTLRASGGSAGYLASANGTGSRALFTLPLSQITLSWPAPGALLAESASDSDSPGIAFSVSTKTGAVSQLLYAQGVAAIADKAFSTVIYQTTASGSRLTYAHSTATGQDRGLSFQPIPEKCTWSPTASSTLLCAAPTAAVPFNYLDLWHQGLLNPPDALFAFNTQTGATVALASPGSTDGGAAANVSSLGVSPDGKYLLYITRGDRSLWGVRLSD